MPSIGRSSGTFSAADASAANVLYQSWQDSISSLTTPGLILPGQFAIARVRVDPSHGGVMKHPRNGPFDPPSKFGSGASSVALSLEKTMRVLSLIPALATQSTIWPTR